jgi:hypothetical protein
MTVVTASVGSDPRAGSGTQSVRLIKPLITEEIAAKEKDIKRLRVRLGLSSWCKRCMGAPLWLCEGSPQPPLALSRIASTASDAVSFACP